MRLTFPLPPFAMGALAALASCVVVVACSLGEPTADVSAASIIESDGGVDAPQRVCPSRRYPDGGWITVDGLDTSDYDYANWDDVARNHPSFKYAFARVSAGLIRVDTRFKYDWPGIKHAGLIRGAYQYFKPSQSADAQAELFEARLREEGGLDATDFPPVLDMEAANEMPAATIVCRIKRWLTHIERATHRLPMIYTSAVWSPYFASEFKRYPLWISNYVGTPSQTCPRMPEAWDKWKLWQYGDNATFRGVYANGSRDDDAGGSIALTDAGVPIAAGTDINYFDGTNEELRAFIASTASTGVVADPPPLVDPPHVSSPDSGPPADCSDGCCIVDP